MTTGEHVKDLAALVTILITMIVGVDAWKRPRIDWGSIKQTVAQLWTRSVDKATRED